MMGTSHKFQFHLPIYEYMYLVYSMGTTCNRAVLSGSVGIKPVTLGLPV